MTEYFAGLIEDLLNAYVPLPTEHIVTIGAFGQQTIAELDGIDVLLREGAIDVAGLQLRTLFEIFLYVEWITQKDTAKRANAYWAWKLRQSRALAAMHIPGTPEYENIIIKLPSALKANNLVSQAQIEQYKQSYQKLDSDLKSAFNDENTKFDKLRKKKLGKEKSYDVRWYALDGGPQNISQIAEVLGRSAEYALFYERYSDQTHATAMNLEIHNGEMNLQFVRSTLNFKEIFEYSIVYGYRIIETLCKKYSQTLKKNLEEKLAQWQSIFEDLSNK